MVGRGRESARRGRGGFRGPTGAASGVADPWRAVHPSTAGPTSSCRSGCPRQKPPARLSRSTPSTRPSPLMCAARLRLPVPESIRRLLASGGDDGSGLFQNRRPPSIGLPTSTQGCRKTNRRSPYANEEFNSVGLMSASPILGRLGGLTGRIRALTARRTRSAPIRFKLVWKKQEEQRVPECAVACGFRRIQPRRELPRLVRQMATASVGIRSRIHSSTSDSIQPTARAPSETGWGKRPLFQPHIDRAPRQARAGPAPPAAAEKRTVVHVFCSITTVIALSPSLNGESRNLPVLGFRRDPEMNARIRSAVASVGGRPRRARSGR